MKFWVSWYQEKQFSGFELEYPWWITGSRCSDDADTICAAVIASTKEDAREYIYNIYDIRPSSIEFRFVEWRADDWTPFGDRFRRSEWMDWPEENK